MIGPIETETEVMKGFRNDRETERLKKQATGNWTHATCGI